MISTRVSSTFMNTEELHATGRLVVKTDSYMDRFSKHLILYEGTYFFCYSE